MPPRAGAQDAFEIQVYEYATVPRGKWNLETHFNYTGRGTRIFEEPVAPTSDQTHLTFELTRGLSACVEMAGYLVLPRRSGHSPDFVACGFARGCGSPSAGCRSRSA